MSAIDAAGREGLERVRVLRSKNAGPFALTFDIVLRDRADFDQVKQNLSANAVARAYAIDPCDVLGETTIERLNAVKVSIRRPLAAGHPGDSDCYGMNQEEPLVRLVLQILGGPCPGR
jgi:hypothetical protein